jgi:phytoene desaturase
MPRSSVDRDSSPHGPRPTVVVIGAGLGGLAAAIRLANAGCAVTVVETHERPGGKLGTLERGGFRFDTGPTIFTLPGLLADLFADSGERLADHLDLVPVEPAFRFSFRDGVELRLGADLRELTAQLTALDPRDVAGFLAFLARSSRIYDELMTYFFRRSFGGPREMFAPRVARAGLALDVTRSLEARMRGYFRDPHLRHIMTFKSIYVGTPPHQVPAAYAAIPYLEFIYGVWFARGGRGLHAIAEELAALAERRGVTIRYRAPVKEIAVGADGARGRARGVILADDEFIPADAVVSNADLTHTYGELIAPRWRRKYTAARLARYEPSSSAFILYLGVDRAYERLEHHNVFFPEDYAGEMRRIFVEKRPPADPTIYIGDFARSDPALAPPGQSALYVLAPVPHITPAFDWAREADAYRDLIIGKVKGLGLPDIEERIVVEERWTPLDFAARHHNNRGSIFGLSGKWSQSTFFHPPNRSEEVRGLYLVGGSAQPGGGIPLVLLSGEITAGLVAEDLLR